MSTGGRAPPQETTFTSMARVMVRPAGSRATPTEGPAVDRSDCAPWRPKGGSVQPVADARARRPAEPVDARHADGHGAGRPSREPDRDAIRGGSDLHGPVGDAGPAGAVTV